VAGEPPEPKPAVVEMKEMSAELPEPLSVAAKEAAAEPQATQSTVESRESRVDGR